MPIENKKYKDTVFRMLFNNKAHLLELYNAINGTNHTNPEDLTITTLSGETFLKVKNDLSFIINDNLNIFEHQSTPCPNIPLRDLYYLAANLKKLYPTEKLYGSNMIKIPAPKFIMFYNGETSMEDKVTFCLSDMFSKPVKEPSIELKVTALNINAGHNKELMEACKTLKGYSLFVAKVRKYKQEAEEEYDSSHYTPLKLLADKTEVMNQLVKSAINKTIDECIHEGILRDFFTDYRKEIVEVGVLEYSYERHMQIVQDDSFNNGVNTGINIGVNNTNDLYSWLFDQGRNDEVAKATKDPAFLNQLFEEYEKWKKDNKENS